MKRSCLVLIGLLVGCQDGFSVDADESNFCDEVAEVACHNMYQCCTEDEIESNLGVTEPRTEVQCREDKKRECIVGSASVRDSLKAGRATFDAETFNACLKALAAPDDTCATYVTERPWIDACKNDAIVGTVAAGGACFFSHDCAGGTKNAICAANQKCEALPAVGSPCPAGVCASGAFCGTNAMCQAQLAEGSPCTSNTQCKENLFCDTSATPTPLCSSRKPQGSACTSDLACDSGECVPGTCMGTQQSCYTDSNCSAHCANSTQFCTVGLDYSCNTTAGHCDVVTTTACSGSTADSQCVTAAAGTKCIFNVACLPGDCVGDPVCTAPLFLVDYCELAIAINP